MTDLFEIICDPDEVSSSIFRTTPTTWMAPYEVPYVKNRLETENVQDSILGALWDAGGFLIVRSRSGLGKTREVAELSKQLCSEGWSVCVAKGSDSDTVLNRLISFPDELHENRLLLIFDDLHHRVDSSIGDQASYSERLEALLSYFVRKIRPSDLRVIATACDEPFYEQKLGFDPSQPPWCRFKQYELPEFTLDILENMLIEWADLAHVDIDRKNIESMIANSDRTPHTIYKNIDRVRVNNQSLTLESWLPSRGESWDKLYSDVKGRYQYTKEVYLALHLIRDAGLPTRYNYVMQLSNKFAQDYTQTTLDGLIDTGLMGSRRGVLDPFSDEQLLDSLRNTGSSLPEISDYWIPLIDAITEITEKTDYWLEDLNKLSLRLVETNDYENAIKITDFMITRYPDEAAAYITRGVARIALGDRKKGEEDFSAAIELGQDNAGVYMLRSTLKMGRNDIPGMEADFVSAIQQNPENQNTYLHIGIMQGFLGNNGAAEVAFDKAIENGMSDSEIFTYRAFIRQKLGDIAGAIADLTSSLEHDPDNARVYFNRGFLRMSDEPLEALTDLNNAIARGIDDADVYAIRGSTRASLGILQGAEEDITTAIARGRDDAALFYLRGTIRTTSANFVDAEKDYSAAIERGKDEADVYYFRGTLREELGNLARAESDFNSVIKRESDYPDIYHKIGMIQRNAKRWEEAFHLYQRAVTIDDSNGTYWTGLADCADKIKDNVTWREAIERAKQYIDTDNLYNAACLASVAKEEDQAIMLLEQALKEKPQLAEWAKKDPDLNWIRDNPRFLETISSVKRKFFWGG